MAASELMLSELYLSANAIMLRATGGIPTRLTMEAMSYVPDVLAEDERSHSVIPQDSPVIGQLDQS